MHRAGLDNEANLGLGLSYRMREDDSGVSFVQAGFYRDSGSNLAKVVGVGYQYKLGERWRLGGALAGFHSRTYNHGDAFITPIPILTYDFGPARLNMIYLPRYGDYNHFSVFGFYFSVPLAR